MPAPTLQRDLSSAGPCPYQRSTRVSRPGGNTPRTIEGRATKPYPAERPDPVHRGAHKVTGGEARTGQWAEHADLRWPHLSIAVLMGLPFLSGIVASADGADATPADGPDATPADGADARE